MNCAQIWKNGSFLHPNTCRKFVYGKILEMPDTKPISINLSMSEEDERNTDYRKLHLVGHWCTTFSDGKLQAFLKFSKF